MRLIPTSPLKRRPKQKRRYVPEQRSNLLPAAASSTYLILLKGQPVCLFGDAFMRHTTLALGNDEINLSMTRV